MTPTLRLPAHRAYSTQQHPAASTKPVSPHVSFLWSLLYMDSNYVLQIGFYKSFGWPVAKVFLGAVLTYQVTYLLWAKLEAEDSKEQKRGPWLWSPITKPSYKLF